MVLAEPQSRDVFREAGETIMAAAAVSNLFGVPPQLANVQPPLAGLDAQSAGLNFFNSASTALLQTLGPLASVALVGIGLNRIASGLLQ
jgi:hypothetical protein